MCDYDDDYLDELYADRHKRQLQSRLRHIEPGHPDEEEILNALEGEEDDE